MIALQEELVTRLRGGMDRRGVSQAQLARASGLTPKHINQMVKGHIPGSLDAWQRLFDALDAPDTQGEVTCILCGRTGTRFFILEDGEFRCSRWGACRQRQRAAGFRPVGPMEGPP